MTFSGIMPQGGTAQSTKTNVNDLVDGDASLTALRGRRPDLAFLVSWVRLQARDEAAHGT
jgi:hypothetical protein